VKQLKKEAELIGGLCGQAQVGDLSWADVADVIGNGGSRERMQEAFSAAVGDVGESKALKAAHKAARYAAEAPAFVRKIPKGDVESRAEAAIDKMLGRA
jgi:hypothetical protein